jgi:hypothetical protein
MLSVLALLLLLVTAGYGVWVLWLRPTSGKPVTIAAPAGANT